MRKYFNSGGSGPNYSALRVGPSGGQVVGDNGAIFYLPTAKAEAEFTSSPSVILNGEQVRDLIKLLQDAVGDSPGGSMLWVDEK